MQTAIDVTRRSFLVHAGRGTIALAVLSVTGCGPSAVASAVPSASSDPEPSASPSAEATASAGDGSGSSPPASSAAGGVSWQRANLGFVSAYVLVRAGEAAIVDTGVGGSEGTIRDALVAAGVDWADVAHVILTHKHGDHVGSIDAVLGSATSATGYAGGPISARSPHRGR
jgi:beta-lactamase superfamily II metal-dependent hydrolase